jgi:hypothetical protein
LTERAAPPAGVIGTRDPGYSLTHHCLGTEMRIDLLS